ncbi:protein kinase domain containing protein [Nitzschia inconspicua]|uniref:Protein kinase domain containing protein n=1 Tax=Nitzschia inconspicua TaxID=303405 RepID=A0A9K3PVH0_9STRA|nr:protein kinase domain containing protein [Nitzschia inconspicua]
MEDLDFLENATASFADIEANGDPVMPLPFDRPKVGRAVRVDAPVFNPVTKDVLKVSNIIYEHHTDGRPPDRAYWVGRKLKKCIFGVVKECTILRFRNDPETPWEVTEHKAAGKIMSWQKIKDLQHIEDPQKEVAAMQFVSRAGTHPHVMGVLDVLQDEEYLLIFMPFCTSGDLFGFVQQAGRFPEPMARYWFKQILEGLSHLQRMGVCHRDMSLENILVDEYTRSVVIDLGMCLRVPFDSGDGEVRDVTGGGLRRLIKPLIPCGKPNYISPEILASDVPFDGFAVDLWASGVILFIMLVGLPPWEFARPEDPRFKMVSKGKLARMLESWKRPVSSLAADLLQKMLMEDPRQRLSLSEVKDHPWVVNDFASESITYQEPANGDEGWRG